MPYQEDRKSRIIDFIWIEAPKRQSNKICPMVRTF